LHRPCIHLHGTPARRHASKPTVYRSPLGAGRWHPVGPHTRRRRTNRELPWAAVRHRHAEPITIVFNGNEFVVPSTLIREDTVVVVLPVPIPRIDEFCVAILR